jgi:hypothetical protein
MLTLRKARFSPKYDYDPSESITLFQTLQNTATKAVLAAS